MNRSLQNGFKSLSIEKPLGFFIKKLSVQNSAWRNLFPDRETCLGSECGTNIKKYKQLCLSCHIGGIYTIAFTQTLSVRFWRSKRIMII